MRTAFVWRKRRVDTDLDRVAPKSVVSFCATAKGDAIRECCTSVGFDSSVPSVRCRLHADSEAK
jgi:hypothetical protein